MQTDILSDAETRELSMHKIEAIAGDALLAPLVKSVLPKIAQAILGIGRSKMYEALGRGDLSAVKDGQRTLITTESIAHYQANRPAAVFKRPGPARMEGLDRLHAKQRAARLKRHVQRRARAGKGA
jgi:hypothetical protein